MSLPHCNAVKQPFSLHSDAGQGEVMDDDIWDFLGYVEYDED